MLEDILEESWTYKEIIQKGMQKGLEKGVDLGLQQGLEKGREEERQQRIQEQRQTLLNLIQMRFPELTPVAKQQVTSIKKAEVLHDLIVKLFTVQTAEEAKQVLMETETQENDLR
jgi:hypothetical protein